MVYISSSCVKDDNILSSIKKIGTISSNIELSGGSKLIDNLFQNIVEIKEKKNMNFLVHSYFPPPAEDFVLNFADLSDTTRNFITKSMEYVNNLDIKYYSIHAGFRKDFKIENEILIDGINEFELANIRKNVEWFYNKFVGNKLALENLYPNNKNETCFASHIDEIEEILSFDKRIYLLFDLGHLKISSRYYKFDYLKAVNLIFEKYSNRILEIHLSENNGIDDSHDIIHTDSIQYMIIEKYKKEIKRNNINLTIEARGCNLAELKDCYNNFNKIIGD